MALVGSVKKWVKSYGFITVLSQDHEHSNAEMFCHNTSLNVKNNEYRTLYPGEYVSFNIGKGRDGRDTCIDVTGVMGGPLLTEHPRFRFKYYEKHQQTQERHESQHSQHSQHDQETLEAEETQEEAEAPVETVEEDDNDPEA